MRGEGKLTRGIDQSVWLVSNELLEVDLRLDSRVASAMSDEAVFFPPYGTNELEAVLAPRLARVTRECLEQSLETTEREATLAKLLDLLENHFLVLIGVTGWDQGMEIKQPVTTTEVHDIVQGDEIPAEFRLGERAVREVITDLETMGLVETWIDSRNRDGRVKQLETTFDPQWVRDAIEPDATESTYLAALSGN